MSGKTAAATIRSLVKERAELRAHWVRVDGSLKHTERLLLKERARTVALGEAISAAGAMLDALDAGEREEARLILVAGRRAYVNRLRDEVAYEPGGIAYRSPLNESELPQEKR